MKVMHNKYNDEFIKQCKKEFGLDPYSIKETLSILAAHGYADVNKLISDVDRLKVSLEKSTVYTNSLINRLNSYTSKEIVSFS